MKIKQLLFFLFKKKISLKHYKEIKTQLRGFDCIYPKNIFENLRDSLTISKINIKKSNINSIYGDNSEIITRQFLLNSNIHYITSKILFYFGENKINNKVSIALPNQWLIIISQQNIRINFLLSFLKWYLKIFLLFLYNELFLIKNFFYCFYNFLIYKNTNKNFGDHVYFIGLNTKNFSNHIEKTNNVVTNLNLVYLNYQYKNILHDCSDVKTFYDNNTKVQYSPLFFNYPRQSFLKLTLWVFKSFFKQIFFFLIFDWPSILLLRENFINSKFKYQNSEFLPKKYLFHNSNWTYRPAWTYEVEKFGTRIELYFYSVNITPFNSYSVKGIPYYGYKSMNWPYYLLWDNFQADYLNLITSKENSYKIIGPVNFSNQNNFYFNKRKKTIAVFDVQPLRDTIYKLTGGIELNYYTIDNCKNFIIDIFQMCNENGFDIIYKKKRDVGKLLHLEYKNLINKLTESDFFFSIDECASLIDIFKYTDIVICQPYTSVAIIAKIYGKNVIFYESSDILLPNDFSTHQIPFVKTRKHLESFIKNNLETSII